MKKSIAVVFVVLVVGAVVFLQSRLVQKKREDQAHNKEFRMHRHQDFLEQLERRDRIPDLADYTKQKEETAQRYEEFKETPQTVWGKIVPAEGQALIPPLRVSMRGKSPQSRNYGSIAVDDQMRFIFPEVEPNTYDLVLLETSSHPGVRFENVIVKEGHPLTETVIEIDTVSLEVTVLDQRGTPVKDVQVLVGKSSSGSDSDLYAWRNGLTDANGRYIACNLTDGEYVVSAHTLKRNGSQVVSLVSGETNKVVQSLTHDNW